MGRSSNFLALPTCTVFPQTNVLIFFKKNKILSTHQRPPHVYPLLYGDAGLGLGLGLVWRGEKRGWNCTVGGVPAHCLTKNDRGFSKWKGKMQQICDWEKIYVYPVYICDFRSQVKRWFVEAGVIYTRTAEMRCKLCATCGQNCTYVYGEWINYCYECSNFPANVIGGLKVNTKPQRVAVGFVDPGLFHLCCGGGLKMGTLLVMDTVARA